MTEYLRPWYSIKDLRAVPVASTAVIQRLSFCLQPTRLRRACKATAAYLVSNMESGQNLRCRLVLDTQGLVNELTTYDPQSMWLLFKTGMYAPGCEPYSVEDPAETVPFIQYPVRERV